MLYAREGASLGHEALAEERSISAVEGKRLERVAHAELDMLDLVHLAHPAYADAPDDAVASNYIALLHVPPPDARSMAQRADFSAARRFSISSRRICSAS